MRQLFAAVLFVSVLAGCSDSSGPSDVNVTGTYTLRTINGQNLPYPLLVIGTTYRLEVTASTLTVNSNGTYTESTTVREVEGTSTTTETESSSGTWTRTNNAITFTDGEDGTSVTASASNGTITLVEQGFTLVFRR